MSVTRSLAHPARGIRLYCETHSGLLLSFSQSLNRPGEGFTMGFDRPGFECVLSE
jgi:hypothetical protein